VHADCPATRVPQQVFHLRAPLGMRRAAQPEAEGEQSSPVFAGPVLLMSKAFAPQVLPAILRVIVMGIAPKPRRQGLLFLGPGLYPDHAAIDLRLSREEALEGRAGQLAGVPRMVGMYLRVADISPGRHANQSEQSNHDGDQTVKSHANSLRHVVPTQTV